MASCTKIRDQVTSASIADESVKKDGNTLKPNIIILLGDDVGYEIPDVDGAIVQHAKYRQNGKGRYAVDQLPYIIALLPFKIYVAHR